MAAVVSCLARFGLLALLVLGLSGAPTQASDQKDPKLKALFMFGDSLSDTTNLFALTGGQLPFTSPPYFEGRFSNGPLWVETLVNFLELPVDLEISVVDDPLASMQAVGGAFTDTRNSNAEFAPIVAGTGILGQVADFAAAGGKIKRHDLVIVWGGANDYIFEIFPDPVVIVGNLVTAVENLTAIGGQLFIVPNLPDLGDTPFAIAAGLQEELNELTAAHNKLLAKEMAKVARRLRIQILLLDVNGAFTGLEGLFANLIVPCIVQQVPPEPPVPTGACPLKPNGVPDSNAFGGTLYMDVLHPTTQAHSLLGAFAAGATEQAFR